MERQGLEGKIDFLWAKLFKLTIHNDGRNGIICLKVPTFQSLDVNKTFKMLEPLKRELRCDMLSHAGIAGTTFYVLPMLTNPAALVVALGYGLAGVTIWSTCSCLKAWTSSEVTQRLEEVLIKIRDEHPVAPVRVPFIINPGQSVDVMLLSNKRDAELCEWAEEYLPSCFDIDYT
ncbi:MAG: hypothetical protein H6679_05795 [Epsilonproteobacteria bacterium]|nr:hypothetical protein [Campylobacterota bacterium]